MERILLKGELHRMHELNQEIKNIFSEYSISSTGIITGTSQLYKGAHFAELIKETPRIGASMLNSKQIFDAMSKHKKEIVSIIMSNRKVFFGSPTEQFEIGRICDELDIIATPAYKVSRNIINNSLTEYQWTALTSDDVLDLVSNIFININDGQHKTRLTREVIPGLKKTHSVSYTFLEHKSDTGLFRLLIRVNRDFCVSYHLYTCVYM